jgi:hypothetical protein
MALPTESGMCDPAFNASAPTPSPTSIAETTSSNNHKMRSNKDLLNLPAEIRLMIYEHMFPTNSMIVHDIDGSLHSLPDAHHVAADYLGILTTCRKIHTEANPVLYSNTNFEVYIGCFETIFSVWYSQDSEGAWHINPWIDDPRSIVSIKHVRTLLLTVGTIASPEMRTRDWTGQIENDLRETPDLKSLCITLEAIPDGRIDQHETDHALRFLEQNMKWHCHGTDGPFARLDGVRSNKLSSHAHRTARVSLSHRPWVIKKQNS